LCNHSDAILQPACCHVDHSDIRNGNGLAWPIARRLGEPSLRRLGRTESRKDGWKVGGPSLRLRPKGMVWRLSPSQSKRLLIDTPSCHVPDRASGIRALVPLHTNSRHKRPNRRLITSSDLLKTVLATHKIGPLGQAPSCRCRRKSTFWDGFTLPYSCKIPPGRLLLPGGLGAARRGPCSMVGRSPFSPGLAGGWDERRQALNNHDHRRATLPILYRHIPDARGQLGRRNRCWTERRIGRS
jgi:hypothetical protein